MSRQTTNLMLTNTVEQLSCPQSLQGLFHQHKEGYPLPSGEKLEEIIQLARAILFPGYFGQSQVNIHTIKYQIGVNVEQLYHLLCEQILAGLGFEFIPSSASSEQDADASPLQIKCPTTGAVSETSLSALTRRSHNIARKLITRLPELRRILATDVVAAYNGDPAAKGLAEIISCYPVIKALTNYRLAHELCLLGVPLIPRMMTEMAHSETGIDIHPGATIGEYFTIDHGTGVVIGETCKIGRNVKLYQGVTLGAKSFPLDEKGNPIKGIPRHPIIGDNVVIYANATVLGRITIGSGCVVGANVRVTRDMKPDTRKYMQEKTDMIDLEFNNGTGI